MTIDRFHSIPRLMMVVLCGALFCLGLPASSARAGADAEVPYDIPQNSPLATLTVPDSWNPNANQDGVDGASPDRRMFFDVAIVKGTSEAKEVARILAYFKDTGKPVTEASKSETNAMIGGLNARRLIYSMKTARRPETLMIDIARLRNGDHLIVQQWGDLAENSKNGRRLALIMATLNLKR